VGKEHAQARLETETLPEPPPPNEIPPVQPRVRIP
jgi:hypothetical protein